MNSIEAQEEQISISLEQAVQTQEKGEALQRLLQNPDFIKIIMKGYLEEEAIDAVKSLSNPVMFEDKQQALIQKAIVGVGELNQWLQLVLIKADQAKIAIINAETELELLAKEDA